MNETTKSDINIPEHQQPYPELRWEASLQEGGWILSYQQKTCGPYQDTSKIDPRDVAEKLGLDAARVARTLLHLFHGIDQITRLQAWEILKYAVLHQEFSCRECGQVITCGNCKYPVARFTRGDNNV